jgi:hypothetical protein
MPFLSFTRNNMMSFIKYQLLQNGITIGYRERDIAAPAANSSSRTLLLQHHECCPGFDELSFSKN